ncbi:hypothetical protein SAMN05428972_2758 [Rhodanobacter sp. OK091]|nr:hypothetical protein SAMN05428972_2758 [Rhodanobacter sp. OK091]
MNTPQDNNERGQRLNARKRLRQRQRRQGVKRIDYQPSEQVLALIVVDLKPCVGGDFSSVIDRLILKAAGVVPEFRHTSRRRVHANNLAGSMEDAGIGRPVRTRAKDFAVANKNPGIIAAIHAGASDFGELPTWAAGYLSRCAVRDASKRVVCGGRRRRDGKPCEALSVPGKRRCKWHGGCSTGPRTVEGKARVTANLRSRSRSVEA